MLDSTMTFVFTFILPGLLTLTPNPVPSPYPCALPPAQEIQWLTWEEAMKRHQKEPKKIMLDVYTDWCGWCKQMNQNTFGHSLISSYVNDHFYAVKLNAERKEEILFRGKSYKYVSTGKRGYHEFAAKVTQGRLSYPSTVFLDEQLEIIQSIPGYREPQEFEVILTYFARNQHLQTPWETYQRNYTPLSGKP